MPAYFDMSLQFRREDLYPSFMADFDAHLERAGLGFRSGFWEDKGLSQAEIAAWNQKKLNEDFVLGMKTHRSHDYKQTLYRFGDYEEVRGFWMNQYPDGGQFNYSIIIPESEVVDENNYTIFLPNQAERLRELAEKLWQFPAVKAIQTGMEEDDHTKLRMLRKGVPACARPFAIVERDCHPFDDGSRVVELTRGRPGLLLLESDDLTGPLLELPGGLGLLRLEEKEKR